MPMREKMAMTAYTMSHPLCCNFSSYNYLGYKLFDGDELGKIQ
jgi:hypothetical protein